jgi:hypothetical protein
MLLADLAFLLENFALAIPASQNSDELADASFCITIDRG